MFSACYELGTCMLCRTIYLQVVKSLSLLSISLSLEDLGRLAKPNQGQTGIPRINLVSKHPTLRLVPRKNIYL